MTPRSSLYLVWKGSFLPLCSSGGRGGPFCQRPPCSRKLRLTHSTPPQQTNKQGWSEVRTCLGPNTSLGHVSVPFFIHLPCTHSILVPPGNRDHLISSSYIMVPTELFIHQLSLFILAVFDRKDCIKRKEPIKQT